MEPFEEVRQAALSRAHALGAGDAQTLADLLHEQFRWTTHRGQTFNREQYIEQNTREPTVWRSQELGPMEISIVRDTAVLVTVVTDVVVDALGDDQAFRMPVTQVWIRNDGKWRCLAGHAGPRVT